MEDLVVYAFPRNKEEEVRFTLRSYRERDYLDIRLWFQPSAGGEYHPTKKGITLGVECLPELKKGLDKAARTGSELALQRSSSPVK